jgi:hypothetical protein
VTAAADPVPTLDLRGGIIAGGAALILLLAFALFDLQAISLAFGGLLALAADGPGGRLQRFRRTGAWLAGGALLIGLAALLPTGPWPTAILVFAAVGGSSLAAGFDERVGLAALVLGLMAVLQPILADPGGTPAFLAGGLIAGALAAIRSRPPDTGRRPVEGGVVFAIVRAGAVAVAAWLGVTLFDAHPAWTGVTTLFVLAPGAQETLAAAGARLLGTLVGAAIGIGLVALVDEPFALALVIVLAVTTQFAVRSFGYHAVVICITIAVVAGSSLAGADSVSAGTDRVVATVLGAGVAVVPLVISRLVPES